MEYISPRKITVASISGRSVCFEKGVPTYAPPQMHAELIRVGIVPAEEMPEPEPTNGPVEPQIAEEREAALFKAFEKIVLRNKREEFTAAGLPHLSAIKVELGWGVDAKERDPLFQKWNLERSGI
jgi:hypothetical protein